MKILDILSPAAVKVPMASVEKQAAIGELVELLGGAGLIKDPAALKAVVWEREQQRSTGIGEGLAIPHGKSECSSRVVMAIGRPPVPIPFGSVDKKPVRLIVLLASPPARTADHIQALGKISRIMANAAFRDRCFAAPTAEDLYQLFREADA
jgi:mannitol/fructose-specific phosphotransferase system IIA component (Ntr-type)